MKLFIVHGMKVFGCEKVEGVFMINPWVFTMRLAQP